MWRRRAPPIVLPTPTASRWQEESRLVEGQELADHRVVEVAIHCDRGVAPFGSDCFMGVAAGGTHLQSAVGRVEEVRVPQFQLMGSAPTINRRRD